MSIPPERLAQIQEALEMCRRTLEPLIDDLHAHFGFPPDTLAIVAAVSLRGEPGFVATDIDNPIRAAKLLAESAEAILSAVNPGAVAREHFRQSVPPPSMN